jgi:hypothetical protein
VCRPGGGGARAGELVRALPLGTLRRLLGAWREAGDVRQLVVDAVEGLEADAAAHVAMAGAGAARHPFSHALGAVVEGLAGLARGTSPGSAAAERAVRRQLRRFLAREWAAPGFDLAGRAAGREHGTGSGPPAVTPEPERIVRLSLEVGVTGMAVWEPLRRLSEAAGPQDLLEMLAGAPRGTAAAQAFAEHVATPDLLREVLGREPVDLDALDVLVDRLGQPAAPALLDGLAEARDRATRRALFDRLTRLGTGITALVAERLTDRRWYVQRNMLALLRELGVWPATLDEQPFTRHPDARVRREAYRALLGVPERRERAVLDALRDSEFEIVALGLMQARQNPVEEAVPLVVRRMSEPGFPPHLRVQAVRLLARSRAPAALQGLLSTAVSGRTLSGKPKLAPLSPELLAAVTGLASGWAADPRAAAVLAQAARSRSPELRAAARGGAS